MKKLSLILVSILLLINIIGIISAIDVNTNSSINSIGCETASNITINFLNARTSEGVTYESCTDNGQIYEIIISFNGKKIPYYITQDGKYLTAQVNRLGYGNEIIEGDKAVKILMDYLEKKDDRIISYDSYKDLGSLYEVEVIVNYQNRKISYKFYITKDGQYNLMGAISTSDNSSSSHTKLTKIVPKSDKPKIELFIMSYCPYALQMERGIIPVFNALGDKIDEKIRFIHYTMHGDEEVTENYRQLCIREEQGDKYIDYLSTFMEKGDYTSALINAEIDISKLDACMSSTGNSKDYYASDSKLSQQYEVKGSPTLIINGVEVTRFSRDSASILKTICSAFNTAPSECSTLNLSSTKPSAGFNSVTLNKNSEPIVEIIPPTNYTAPNESNINSPKIDEIICNSCVLDNKCYSFGFRKDGSYCDDKNSNFIIQKSSDSYCQNNFECDSNLCIDNKCVSGSLWQEILSWFSHLFDGK